MSTTLVVVSGFFLAILTQFIKGTVYPKWGATGVHVMMFILAALYASILASFSAVPHLKIIFDHAVGILATAITAYETLLSKIGFSGSTGPAPIAG